MTKKKEETLAVSEELSNVSAPAVDQDYKREIALQIALSHHKTNGGMLTTGQLIDNAKHFHAYITGN